MYGIHGNDPFDVQQDQGQDMNAGDRLAGRILSAEYQLGIQQQTPAGQQLAGQALGQLLGLALNRIFR
jgi:hypothetical protein